MSHDPKRATRLAFAYARTGVRRYKSPVCLRTRRIFFHPRSTTLQAAWRTAPPTPSPASPAMIGPAAMNGPRPGIANRPTPASRPSVPPITPPVVTPAAAPSGAFVVTLLTERL
jgi:hypothetical protein